MTSSTPDPVELEVVAGAVRVPAGARAEVPGRGDLRVRTRGHLAGSPVELRVGERVVELVADAQGRTRWDAPGLLGQVAGEVRVAVADREVAFVVRPEKLVADAVIALVTELEAVAEGLALSAGATSTLEGMRSRDRDLSMLDTAVGLAASAAPAIRRRPLHRAREVVRAVAREAGARSARDVRWLATHPVQAVRAEATGRPVGVTREARADLDTLENRGVLSAYDRLEGAVDELRAVVEEELARLTAARPAREAFLTERGNLWQERDQPRFQALQQRRARLDELRHEIGATRSRAGLPDLRPRGARMVRTPRVDAEPAYWTTFRAFQLAEQAEAGEAPPAPAPIRTLDELWEQWCAVVVARALCEVLGPPDGQALVDPGWFSTLRTGEVARWSSERRTVRLLYEPEIGRSGAPRKLIPGRPWRPDLVIEVRWADGTLDLHVLDAKYRIDGWSALHEVWWKYGDSIGDADGWPVVRSVWVVFPGDGVRLLSPRMLDPGWPVERLRGGTIGLTVGRPGSQVAAVLTTLLLSGN
ncbi:MAG: hypothetical protein H6738_12725 [Alphaproteobacteria bacterium]|nr:hypothetical protein [Alphaproteobacteria bacterium]